MRWNHQMMMTWWWYYGVCEQLARAGYTANPGKYSLTIHQHGNFSVVRTYSACYRVLSAWQCNGSPWQFWSLTTHHGNFSVVRTYSTCYRVLSAWQCNGSSSGILACPAIKSSQEGIDLLCYKPQNFFSINWNVILKYTTKKQHREKTTWSFCTPSVPKKEFQTKFLWTRFWVSSVFSCRGRYISYILDGPAILRYSIKSAWYIWQSGLYVSNTRRCLVSTNFECENKFWHIKSGSILSQSGLYVSNTRRCLVSTATISFDTLSLDQFCLVVAMQHIIRRMGCHHWLLHQQRQHQQE